jgi:hypothetical protein
LNYEKTGNQYLFEQENKTYFMEEGELRKEVNHGENTICIAGDQIKHLIKRLPEQNDCYINSNNTIQQILNMPYGWPTLIQDTNDYIDGECPKFKKKKQLKYNAWRLLPIYKKIR